MTHATCTVTRAHRPPPRPLGAGLSRDPRGVWTGRSRLEFPSHRPGQEGGGPGLRGTGPGDEPGGSGGGPNGAFPPTPQPFTGRRGRRNRPPPGPALPLRPLRARGRGAGGRNTPPPRGALGRRAPPPEKPRRPAPALRSPASSRVGGSERPQGRTDCDTNLAVEGFHRLHVVGAEARSPAAEEAAATALRGEGKTEAAAAEGPRAGALARAGPRRPRGRRGRASTGGGRAPSGAARRGHGRRAGGAPIWGHNAAWAGRRRGRGWAAAPLFSARLRLGLPPREPRSLHSPPPSSSSSDGLRLHLPAARAAGTGSARRRRRRKRWRRRRRRLRHPIWRKRVGPRRSERRGARQRAPWRPHRVAAAPARRPSRWPGQSVAARRPGPGTARAPPPPSAPRTRERARLPARWGGREPPRPALGGPC